MNPDFNMNHQQDNNSREKTLRRMKGKGYDVILFCSSAAISVEHSLCQLIRFLAVADFCGMFAMQRNESNVLVPVGEL